MSAASPKRSSKQDADEELSSLSQAELAAYYYDRPLEFVYDCFRWEDLQGFDGPDDWAVDFLRRLQGHVNDRSFNGRDAVDAIRMSVRSGHGIGKSAMVAWLILWILVTRPYCRGVVTAVTAPQLKSKTWPELAKWRRLCRFQWFEMTFGQSMSIYHAQYKELWRVDALTAKEENAESFAGLHAAHSTPFYIFDEASGIPERIWEVAEGGLTDGEPMHFTFGNPTKNVGKFHRIHMGSERDRWDTVRVDSRTVRITNKRLFEEWARYYGEDSDFFRVRCLGEFPRAGELQFIDLDRIEAAMAREVRYNHDDPLIMTVDVARGGEDSNVIQLRKGLDAKSYPVIRIPGEKTRDSMTLVSRIAGIAQQYNPNAIIVDETGIGGPIVDRLRQLGYNVLGVQFGAKAPVQEHLYANFRAYMWARMKEWLESGAIKDHDDLKADLAGPEYGHDAKDRLVLERKEDMKKRGLASPDWGDALAMSFAYHIAPAGMGHLYSRRNQSAKTHDDPMERM